MADKQKIVPNLAKLFCNQSPSSSEDVDDDWSSIEDGDNPRNSREAQALTIRPDFKDLWFNCGQCAISQKDWRSAEFCMTHCEDEFRALEALLVIHYFNNDYLKCTSVLQRIFDAFPDHQTGHVIRRRISESSSFWAECHAKLFPTNISHFNVERALRNEILHAFDAFQHQPLPLDNKNFKIFADILPLPKWAPLVVKLKPKTTVEQLAKLLCNIFDRINEHSSTISICDQQQQQQSEEMSHENEEAVVPETQDEFSLRRSTRLVDDLDYFGQANKQRQFHGVSDHHMDILTLMGFDETNLAEEHQIAVSNHRQSMQFAHDTITDPQHLSPVDELISKLVDQLSAAETTKFPTILHTFLTWMAFEQHPFVVLTLKEGEAFREVYASWSSLFSLSNCSFTESNLAIHQLAAELGSHRALSILQAFYGRRLLVQNEKMRQQNVDEPSAAEAEEDCSSLSTICKQLEVRYKWLIANLLPDELCLPNSEAFHFIHTFSQLNSALALMEPDWTLFSHAEFDISCLTVRNLREVLRKRVRQFQLQQIDYLIEAQRYDESQQLTQTDNDIQMLSHVAVSAAAKPTHIHQQQQRHHFIAAQQQHLPIGLKSPTLLQQQQQSQQKQQHHGAHHAFNALLQMASASPSSSSASSSSSPFPSSTATTKNVSLSSSIFNAMFRQHHHQPVHPPHLLSPQQHQQQKRLKPLDSVFKWALLAFLLFLLVPSYAIQGPNLVNITKEIYEGKNDTSSTPPSATDTTTPTAASTTTATTASTTKTKKNNEEQTEEPVSLWVWAYPAFILCLFVTFFIAGRVFKRSLNADNGELQQKLATQDNELKTLRKDLKSKNEQFTKIEDQLRQVRITKSDGTKQMEQMRQKNFLLEQTLSSENKLKQDLFRALNDSKAEIATLKARLPPKQQLQQQAVSNNNNNNNTEVQQQQGGAGGGSGIAMLNIFRDATMNAGGGGGTTGTGNAAAGAAAPSSLWGPLWLNFDDLRADDFTPKDVNKKLCVRATTEEDEEK